MQLHHPTFSEILDTKISQILWGAGGCPYKYEIIIVFSLSLAVTEALEIVMTNSFLNTSTLLVSETI